MEGNWFGDHWNPQFFEAHSYPKKVADEIYPCPVQISHLSPPAAFNQRIHPKKLCVVTSRFINYVGFFKKKHENYNLSS